MVSSAYLVDKPNGPSSAKVILDQMIIPALIDIAGDMEAMLERLSTRTRSAPGVALGTAFGLGVIVSLALRSRRA